MNTVTIVAVGDVLIDRDEPTQALDGVAGLLAEADLAFGNLEGVLSDLHSATPGSAQATIVPTTNAKALKVFDVMSVANNHSMDAGYGGLHETTEALRHQGIMPVGAGDSLAEP